MNKRITVIVGNGMSGKSFLAKNMRLVYDNPVFIEERIKKEDTPYLLGRGGVTSETDAIFIEVNHKGSIDDLIFSFSLEDLSVSPHSKEDFSVKTPPVYFVIDKEISDANLWYKSLSDSIQIRIRVIETSIKNTPTNKIFNASLLN